MQSFILRTCTLSKRTHLLVKKNLHMLDDMHFRVRETESAG